MLKGAVCLELLHSHYCNPLNEMLIPGQISKVLLFHCLPKGRRIRVGATLNSVFEPLLHTGFVVHHL